MSYISNAWRREESRNKMNSLNLSKEFESFKFEQEEAHQGLLKKLDKWKLGGMIGATALILGATGAMATGASLPLILGSIGASYAAGAIAAGAKLTEMFQKRKHDKNFGTSEAFFKEMDEKAKVEGDDFYEDFVKTKRENPRLAESLSEVSKTFNKVKANQEKQENVQELKMQAIKFRNS